MAKFGEYLGGFNDVYSSIAAFAEETFPSDVFFPLDNMYLVNYQPNQIDIFDCLCCRQSLDFMGQDFTGSVLILDLLLNLAKNPIQSHDGRRFPGPHSLTRRLFHVSELSSKNLRLFYNRRAF